MSAVVRIADNKGRVSLPGFANATVIVEAFSPNEYRVRKAEVIPTDELRAMEHPTGAEADSTIVPGSAGAESADEHGWG